MNLEFPAHVPFSSSPTPPAQEGEAGASALLEALEALKDLGQSLCEQNTITPPFLDAAGFCLGDSSRETIGSGLLAEVPHEAMTAVIGNIAYPTKEEYVWDPAQLRWVLKVIPV